MYWDMLLPPQTAEANNSYSRAAIDDNGRVMLVWYTTAGTYASTYTNGAWSQAVNLGQGGYINSVVSANDSFAVFWQVRNGSTIELYCARYDSGVWQPTAALGAFAADSLYVDAAMFSDESLFIIYRTTGGLDAPQGYSRRFDVSEGWQPPEALGQFQWSVSGFHRFGKAVIAWADSSNRAAFVRSYDVNSGWTAPVSIGQYTNLTAHSAAINGAGNAMVAFSTVNDIRVATTVQGSGWTQLMPIFQKEQSTLYLPPQLALDSDGNAMLVFADPFSLPARYLAIRYASSCGWQQPVDINWGKLPDPLQLGNNLKVDEAGNYLLVWHGYDALPGIEHVYSSRYKFGTGWQAPKYLGRQDADTIFPRVAMNRRGEAVAVWLNTHPPGDANAVMSLGIGLFR